MSIESAIERNIFSTDHEKTFIDKLLSKDEAREISKLMQKDRLKRSELLYLLNLL